jgi:hypothetical protein
MKFLDALAGAGVTLNSVNQAQAANEERRVQEAMRKIALEQGTIGMDRMREERDLERQMRGVGPLTIPGTPEAPIYDEADGQTQIGAKPAIPDQQLPDYESRAAAALKAGRPDLWAKEKAAAKANKNEGVVDLSKALISGQDPATAVTEHYNSKGRDKIDPTTVAFANGVLTGKRANGMDFRLDPKAALIEAGVKQPKVLILKPGDKAIDELSGNLIGEGNPKAETKQRIDPLSPEGIEARKGLEDYKSKLTKGANAPAKVREIEWLTDKFNGDSDKAIALAYGVEKGGKTEEERVLRWAAVLKNDMDLGMNPDKLLAKARSMAKIFSDAGSDKRPGASPKAAPAPSPPAAPRAAPAAGGYTTSDGKVIPEGSRVRNKATGRIQVVRGGQLVDE